VQPDRSQDGSQQQTDAFCETVRAVDGLPCVGEEKGAKAGAA
jgi:hypothetical protein